MALLQAIVITIIECILKIPTLIKVMANRSGSPSSRHDQSIRIWRMKPSNTSELLPLFSIFIVRGDNYRRRAMAKADGHYRKGEVEDDGEWGKA